MIAGLAARGAHLMTALGLIFFVSGLHGSYALAGGAAACYALSYAVVGPVVGRLSDRHGQASVLAIAAPASCLARLGVLAAGEAGWPGSSLLTLSALSGACMPSVAAMVRARWSHLLGEESLLHSAFSLESVLDECVLICGPAAISLLATALSPAVGLLATTALATAGLAGLAVQRSTQPPAARPERHQETSLLTRRGFCPLLIAFVAFGAATSIIEIAVVALCQTHNAKSLSGLVLGVLALASAISGVWYGAHPPTAASGRPLTRWLQLLSAASLLLIAVPNLPILFLAAAVVGATISPVAINGFAAVHQSVPSERLTQGFAWTTSSLGLGIAAGNAIAGQIITTWSTHAAFVAVTACALAGTFASHLSARARGD